MSKRSESEWQQLINDYQTSGLSQTAFCRERNICSKGLKRHQAKQAGVHPATAFVKVAPAHLQKRMIRLLPSCWVSSPLHCLLIHRNTMRN